MQSAKWLSKKLAVFSFVATLAASVVFVPVASAVIPVGGGGGGGSSISYAAMTPDQKAMSYMLYYGVVGCVTGINSISNDDVVRGTFSGASSAYLYSYYADVNYGDGSDGKLSCEPTIRAAVNLWGYGNLDAALTDWGYVNPGNGGDWTNSNPGANTAKALRDRVYGSESSFPRTDNAANYLIWRSALVSGCKISNPVDYNSASQSLRSAADAGSDYVKVTEPTTDYSGTQTTIYSVGGKASTDAIWPKNSPEAGKYSGLSCGGIAQKVSEYAGAFQIWAVNNQADADAVLGSAEGGAPGGDTADNCPLPPGAQMRWLGCAVFAAGYEVANLLREQISKFLFTDVEKIFDNSSARAAATTFRNIGFALIIIAGLAMVIAQASGSDLVDAYTIRKLMPRLAVAMIGIALAWPLLRFAVTLTNDLGTLIYQIFMSIPQDAGTQGAEIGFGSGITALLTGMAAGAGLWLVIGTAGVVSLLWTVTLALFIGFLVLAIRQIVIFMAVILAPLAIAAYVLPGTQKLWNFWQNTFTTALLMYPIIMGFIGAGAAMSYLLGGVSDGGTDSLLAIVVYFAPFFMLPFAFKLAGGLMSTIFSIANDKNRGLFDRAKKFRADRASKNWGDMRDGNRFKSKNAVTNRLNAGLGYATNVDKAGFNPRQMRSKMRTALADHAHDEASEFMKENHAFNAISGDDAKLYAARAGNRSEIERRLAEFDDGRFGGVVNQRAREDAATQILRAQREADPEVFQRARTRAMAGTGTGYQYTTEDGHTAVDYTRMIDDINAAYGNDRNGAGRALAEMRGSLKNSGHFAGDAGFGTWAQALEGRYRNSISADQAQEMIMDDAINSVQPGAAIYGKPTSAGAMGAAHARRLQRLANEVDAAHAAGGGAPTAEQSARIQQAEAALDTATASAAGILDAMGSAAPQNAAAMSQELMGVEIRGSTVRNLIDERMSNDHFRQMRKDYGTSVREQAEAERRRTIPPGGAEPAGPPAAPAPPGSR